LAQLGGGQGWFGLQLAQQTAIQIIKHEISINCTIYA
jgi:hypothetical protein